VIRRHRLAECLLTQVLGMPWDEVHEEACRLEHAISARVEERLLEVLGHPTTCPHGQPIPPTDLSDPIRLGIPLAQLDAGAHAIVDGVTEELSEMLRYLGEIGMRPGAEVEVLEKAPCGGPITLRLGERQHAVSLELARMVTVIIRVDSATERALA